MSATETLRDGAVALRPPEKADFPVLSQLRNDASLQRQLMIGRGRHSSAQVRAWIRRRTTDPEGVFFVVAAEGAVGFVQLAKIDRRQGTADLGICLAQSARGTGTASKAMALLERFSRRRLRCSRMTLRVLRGNHRAIAFYRKAGFRDIGIERRSYDDDGCWRDVLFMEKLLA
jgi:RimJ/RimL family protein N-acetyltransferase